MPESTVQLAGICNLLGRLWLQEVTAETIEAMQAESFRADYEELGGFIPANADASTVEALAIEYCELLIGPRDQISPVQSVWTDNQLQSETSSSMHRFFELLPSFKNREGLPDHIGVQLEFVGDLLTQPDSAVAEILTLFIEKHLRWTQGLLDEVVRRTHSEFYRGLAVVTAALIQVLSELAAQS